MKMNQKGFGLLQALLAIGALGGVSIVFINSMEQSNKLIKTNEYYQESNELTGSLFKTLSNKQACINSFNMMNAQKSAPAKEIKNADNDSVVTLNSQFGTSGVKIKEMYLEDMPGYTDGVKVNPGNSGSTNLYVRFQSRNSSFYEKRTIQRRIKLWVLTDGSSNIKSCYAVSSGEDLIWQRSKDDPNNIFYAAGNVGIGTENPEEKLDVMGWIQTQNPAGDKLLIGGDNTSYSIKAKQDKPIVFWNDSTSKHGDISVGNIEANGLVKLKGSGTACNPNNVGAMRYNTNIKRVQVCDGTHWLTKAIVKWCLPPARIKKGDDEWINFKQNDSAVREEGTPCDNSQVESKKHANIDGTGFKVNFDDTDRACSNQNNCKDWRESEQ